MNEKNVSIAALQETKNSKFSAPGWACVRTDRPKGKGGGLALLVTKNVKFTVVAHRRHHRATSNCRQARKQGVDDCQLLHTTSIVRQHQVQSVTSAPGHSASRRLKRPQRALGHKRKQTHEAMTLQKQSSILNGSY